MRMYVLGLVLAGFTLAATPSQAQVAHTAPQSALDAALEQGVATVDADRATVLRLLERSEVKDIAGTAGLDLRTAAGAVATMNPQQLRDVAAQASQVEQALAGGQSTVTISTTVIVIVLLIIILIVVAT